MVKPVSYLQTDPRWANLDYSAPGEKTTIGKSGCGPTAMAMVLATWVDKCHNPVTECDWAKNNGFKANGQGTYYGYFEAVAKKHRLRCYRLNYSSIYGNSKSAYHSQAKDAVDRGDLVIACMGPGNWTRSGHYVLVWKIDGNVIFINDPASTNPTRTRGAYSLFRQQVKYYFVIENPGGVDNAEVQEKEKEEGVQEVTYYETLDQIPEGELRETIKDLVDLGIVKGTGKGLHLSEDMVRILVYLRRANVI